MNFKDGNTKHFSKKVCERGSKILKINDHTDKRYYSPYHRDVKSNLMKLNKDIAKNYIRNIINRKIFC